MIKNAFNPGEHNISKVFRGAKEQAKAYLERELVKAGIHGAAISSPSGPADTEPVPESLSSPATMLHIVEGWDPHSKDDELPATDAPKNDQDPGGSSSKDDSQQSSDTEGADVEDNPGGAGGGDSPAAILDAYNSPSVPPSRSRSPSSSRSQSPHPILGTEGTQARPGLNSRRRESFRRKLFGRSPFTLRGHGRHGDRKGSRSAAASSTQSDDEAGDSENDEDDSPVQPGPPPRLHSINTHHRSRSESPRRVAASAGGRGRRRHQQSEHRFELSPPESRDEVDDPQASSSAPSPNVLHQRLDTLAAAAAAASDQPPNASASGESRQNSLGSPTASTSPDGRSPLASLSASGTLASGGGGSATRSIRFAEELGFERNDSSGSLNRMGGGGAQHQHQHLRYQHTHGVRRSSPGPSGATTPRSRIAPIGTPIGAAIGGSQQ